MLNDPERPEALEIFALNVSPVALKVNPLAIAEAVEIVAFPDTG